MPVLLAGGCAVQPRVVTSSVWPATFSDRKFSFRHGLVMYAGDSFAAEINARHIAEIEREFTRNTGRSALSGLVIINDVADTRIGNLDLNKLLPDEKHEPQLIEMGFTIEEIVLTLGLPVAKEQFNGDSGFTPAALRTVQWVVSVPSPKQVEKFRDHLIDAGLKRQHFNFFQRMLIAPFMPLIHGLIDDVLNAQRDTALYACICDAQPGWSSDRKKQESDAYTEKRMGAVVNSLKAATQQVKGSGGQ